ncbi:MAG TPA: Uma2 family endonuclease [Candidatus Binatia bacterium]|nr:Uma2 family endonuclease [Candidatus Binatia bacterium]
MKATVLPDIAIRRWTRAEYDRLIGLGVFQPGERLELLDGWLVLREPQGTRHSTGIRRVLSVLRRTLGETWQIDSQLPIALDDLSEPEPDVSVVPGNPDSYLHEHPSHPRLIVEVAESSYRIDHEYKASLYARAGVPEYWILDLVHQTVEIHRGPEESAAARYGWRYRSIATLQPPATVAPLLAPDRPIAVADLLP